MRAPCPCPQQACATGRKLKCAQHKPPQEADPLQVDGCIEIRTLPLGAAQGGGRGAQGLPSSSSHRLSWPDAWRLSHRAAVDAGIVAGGLRCQRGDLSDHLLQRVVWKRGQLEPQLLRWHHAQWRRAIPLVVVAELVVGGGARRNVHPDHGGPVLGRLEWGGVGGSRLWTKLLFEKRFQTRHQVFCCAVPSLIAAVAAVAAVAPVAVAVAAITAAEPADAASPAVH
eukprot:scaffold23757_cov37-Phaeocystis_antarctica.AAC.1